MKVNSLSSGEKQSKKKEIKPAQTVAGLIIFLTLIGIFVWWIWPRGPVTVTAIIQISSNTSWSGSIGADGQTTTVDGSGSKSFMAKGTIIVAVIQKQTESGYLTVSIIVDGQTKASQTTTAAYGVVSVSWSP
jgi:hypothetical protein